MDLLEFIGGLLFVIIALWFSCAEISKYLKGGK